MPDTFKTVEEQHLHLCERLVGKQVLICLDDCWTFPDYEMLNCMDTATESAMFVTTRVSGLVNKCVELRLGLMTEVEAVDLLASAAHLDGEAVPPALMLAVKMTGRLPLCLK